MALLIRQATEADVPDILHLINDAILHTTAVYQEVPQTLEFRIQWYKERVSNGFPIIIAVVEGRFAGFATYGLFRTGYGYRHTVEHSVYVNAGQRGKGIGKLLVQELISIARQNNIHTTIAGIDAATQPSINMHLSLGFKEVAYIKEVGFKFGRWLDLKLLQLVIE